MVRHCLVYVAIVTCGPSVGLLSAANADPRAVVELFTSQGCSSCPPADQLMGELAADPSLVAVSLPIDYWDYLGWKDTLADPRNSARQKAYSQVRGDREVYTPQVVINGALHVLGSDRGEIEHAIELSHQSSEVMSVPVNIAVAGGRVAVSVMDAAMHVGAEVWLISLSRSIPIAIGRGENRGKTITYHNVVRQWLRLGSFSGKAETWNVPVRNVDHDGLDQVAVMVQSGTVAKPSAILGASVASLH
jgi:hypothetical protein